MAVRKYLCPSVDHNPWCPKVPGQHGFIFVGLGRERDTFNQPEEHPVFVGLQKKGKNTRRFRYMGQYEATRVTALTPEEWKDLPQDVSSLVRIRFYRVLTSCAGQNHIC